MVHTSTKEDLMSVEAQGGLIMLFSPIVSARITASDSAGMVTG